MIIDVGGRQYLTDKYKGEYSTFLDAFMKRASTALHDACRNMASTKVIMKIIDVGGSELVMAKNKIGYTTLQCACKNYASTEVMMKMIEVGGRELVMEKNNFGDTALHHLKMDCR